MHDVVDGRSRRHNLGRMQKCWVLVLFFLFLFLCPIRFFEPFGNRLHHFSKPVEVQATQRSGACKICYCEPWRHGKLAGILESAPNIGVHPIVLIVAPYQATAAERC